MFGFKLLRRAGTGQARSRAEASRGTSSASLPLSPHLRRSRLTQPCRWDAVAARAYSLRTHYSLGQIQSELVQFQGGTVMVSRVMLSWTSDTDGRVRTVDELNLGHLDAEIMATRSEPPLGEWQRASVVLRGANMRTRYFPKD